MKLLKRMSPMTAVMRHFWGKNENPITFWLSMKRLFEYNMNVEEELAKNGFTTKPQYSPSRFVVFFSCGVLGVFTFLYFQSLYRVLLAGLRTK
jgi:hypothetical protein